MGCNESTNSTVGNSLFADKMKEAIDSGSINRISTTLSMFKKKFNPGENYIDHEIVKINKISLNPLAYSLFLGKSNVFKYLYEKGASLKVMNDLLKQHNMRTINIICYKGYKEILEYYLPLYLKEYNSVPESTKSFTLDFKDTLTPTSDFDLPIHSACRAGMVHIVLYIYKYFQDKSYCPREFDINSTDDHYGEDAGLISCRTGCFSLVKMLHENCGVTFQKLNNLKENAIMICASGFKASPNYSYIECVSYLVEVANVDITYMYEELLYLVEGQEFVEYIELQLAKKGINAKKSEADKVASQAIRVIREEADNSGEPIFTDEVRRFLTEDSPSFLSAISERDFKQDSIAF